MAFLTQAEANRIKSVIGTDRIKYVQNKELKAALKREDIPEEGVEIKDLDSFSTGAILTGVNINLAKDLLKDKAVSTAVIAPHVNAIVGGKIKAKKEKWGTEVATLLDLPISSINVEGAEGSFHSPSEIVAKGIEELKAQFKKPHETANKELNAKLSQAAKDNQALKQALIDKDAESANYIKGVLVNSALTAMVASLPISAGNESLKRQAIKDAVKRTIDLEALKEGEEGKETFIETPYGIKLAARQKGTVYNAEYKDGEDTKTTDDVLEIATHLTKSLGYLKVNNANEGTKVKTFDWNSPKPTETEEYQKNIQKLGGAGSTINRAIEEAQAKLEGK